MNFKRHLILWTIAVSLVTPVGEMASADTPPTAAPATPSASGAATGGFSFGASPNQGAIDACRKDYPNNKTTDPVFKECMRGLGFPGDSSCQTLQTAYRTAAGKARAACVQSGGSRDVSECEDKANECGQANGGELSQVATQLVMSATTGSTMSASTYRGQCLDDKSYQDHLKEIRQRLKDAQKKTSDIGKDTIKAQEDAQKDQRDVQNQIQDMNKQGRKEDADNASAQRKAQGDQAAAQISAQQRVRQMQSDILRSQGALAKMIGDRAQQLAQMTDALSQKNCLEQLEKIRNQLSKVATTQANYTIRQNSENTRRLRLTYKSCLDSAQQLRETTRQASADNIAAAEADIKSKAQEIGEVQSGLSLANSQQAQQSQQDAQNQQQATVERYNRLMTLQQQQSTISSALQARITQFNTELTQSKQDEAQASNDLATLGSKGAGPKSPPDALAAIEEMNAARETNNSTPGCAPISDDPSADSTTSGTGAGADGTTSTPRTGGGGGRGGH